MTEKQLFKLINEIFEKVNFIANISIVVPKADIKALLEVLPNNVELFNNPQISWRVTDVNNEGITLEIDRTNYPHWERKRIMNTTEFDNVILKVDNRGIENG